MAILALPLCSIQVVHFPGAPHITVSFDLKTDTRLGDYVTLYKDETLTETWGPVVRLTGGALNIGRKPGTLQRCVLCEMKSSSIRQSSL